MFTKRQISRKRTGFANNIESTAATVTVRERPSTNGHWGERYESADTLCSFGLFTAFCQGTGCSAGRRGRLDKIVKQVEKRYDVPGFTADFHQISTIKAMDIADQATGKVSVRKPEMMRWEYEKPEHQIIITNAERLWIYRPQDNQVIVGKAPAFLAGGKGAGFLADIKILRRKFDISVAPSDADEFHVLKLVPIEKTIDVG